MLNDICEEATDESDLFIDWEQPKVAVKSRRCGNKQSNRIAQSEASLCTSILININAFNKELKS